MNKDLTNASEAGLSVIINAQKARHARHAMHARHSQGNKNLLTLICRLPGLVRTKKVQVLGSSVIGRCFSLFYLTRMESNPALAGT